MEKTGLYQNDVLNIKKVSYNYILLFISTMLKLKQVYLLLV